MLKYTYIFCNLEKWKIQMTQNFSVWALTVLLTSQTLLEAKIASLWVLLVSFLLHKKSLNDILLICQYCTMEEYIWTHSYAYLIFCLFFLALIRVIHLSLVQYVLRHIINTDIQLHFLPHIKINICILCQILCFKEH